MASLTDLYAKYGQPVANFAKGVYNLPKAASQSHAAAATRLALSNQPVNGVMGFGDYAKSIAAPVQGAVNTVRAVPALGYGIKGALTPGQTFKGNIQAFNRALPPAQFATNATQHAVDQGILPKFARTITAAGDLAGGLVLPAPGIGKISALEKLAPIQKLAGYTAARGAEGYVYGAGNNLAQTGDFKQANKAGLVGAATAGIGNAVLSPKLVKSALDHGVESYRIGEGANGLVKKLDATVPTNRIVDNLPGKVPVRSGSFTNVNEVPNQQVLDALVNKGKSGQGARFVKAPDGTSRVVEDTYGTGNLLHFSTDNPKFTKQLESMRTQKPGFVDKNLITGGTAKYIEGIKQGQATAAASEKAPFGQKVTNVIADIKRKLVDSTAPIEDTLFRAQKKGNYVVRPGYDISNQIDRVYRAPQLAGQFAKDNGIVDVIKAAPDINKLDQYLIARHAPDVGTTTGRNAAKDAQLVKELGPTYEPLAQKVTAYTKNLKQYMVDSGLISPELSAQLDKQYPNYVPLNRLFSEAEKTTPVVGRKGVASLSKQTVVQKLQGSERAIQNPTESILQKTQDAFNQGERNKAGQMLASYKDLPGNPFSIGKAAEGANPNSTFSYLENGVKKTLQTTPEVAQAAKLLDKQQLGFIGKVFAMPVRLARIGITGLNVSFTAGNVIRDQGSAFLNSNRAIQTSIANPKVFVSALWNAIGHGNEFENWVRNAGGGTSFDISRETPKLSIDQIRSGKNAATKIAYTVTHPGELLRAAENAIGRSEEFTRLQQFIGTRDALVKEGRTIEDANILAAQQSRNATTNFARSGDWGKALNSVFLYMNAGIQGSRTLVRNVAQRPVQTAAKIGLTVLGPVATVTAWNLNDPQRKAAYDDIADFEKENNLIIVPPNPVKDPATGKWNVIKVPYSQEIANLTIPLRKSMEALQGYDAPGFGDVASSLLGSATSLNTQSQNALIGQFVPQAVKPPLEAALNKNLFTGQDTVPQFLNGQPSKGLPPSEQVKPNTSGTARIVGRALNASPLKVEQFVKSTFGGVGNQIINASDTALNKAGVIPPEQVGGQSIPAGITSRFTQATGGQLLQNMYAGKPTPPGYVVSNDAPKNALDTVKLYAQALIKDPKNAVEGIFTAERLRKMNGDIAVFERKNGLGSQDNGDPLTQVDHKIALTLGGSNNQNNLQILSAHDNAAKGIVEVYLTKLVKDGQISRAEAQSRDLSWQNELPNVNQSEVAKAVSTTIPTNTSQPSAVNYGDLIKEDKGAFYAQVGGTAKKFKTRDEANLAIAKDKFKTSPDSQLVVGGTVLRKSSDGTISSTNKTSYDNQLNSATLTQQKAANNLKAWLDTAQKQYNGIQAQLKDPSLDPLETIRLQNQATTLKDQAQKYQKYGGFTKPKKVGKGKSAASVRAPVKLAGVGKLSAPKVKITRPKAILGKVKLPKITIKQPKRA